MVDLTELLGLNSLGKLPLPRPIRPLKAPTPPGEVPINGAGFLDRCLGSKRNRISPLPVDFLGPRDKPSNKRRDGLFKDF